MVDAKYSGGHGKVESRKGKVWRAGKGSSRQARVKTG